VRAGVDLTGWDPENELFTADLFGKFLTYMSQQPYFPEYRNALPISGNGPAAGHIYAKPGGGMRTIQTEDGNLVTQHNSGLAGFIELPDGRFIVFALLLEIQSQGGGGGGNDETSGVLREIASVAYESLAQ
jgi:serine-type D-Ala-D-Ala carboxypeptidase/endopeptidase (penicillin-binding protein 4)